MRSFKLLNRWLAVLMVASLLLGTSGGLVAAERAPSLYSTAQKLPVVQPNRANLAVEAVNSNVLAAPTSPTDDRQVPRYFGPNPNWANSPFTVPDVTVSIVENPPATGTGATAVASVGANGTITAITLTNPGSGYSATTPPTVNIGGAGTGASATAEVAASGSVTSINIDVIGGVLQTGSGYTAPTVIFSGGGGTGTLVQVGNPLQDRAYATDFSSAPPVVVPASVSPAATQTYDVTAGSANGGSFTLTVDAVTTGAIAWNALQADFQAALDAAVIAATVTGNGPWVVTFATAPTTVTIDGTGLTEATTVAATGAGVTPTAVLEVFDVTAGSANGGSFTLTVDAVTTGAIAWNALQADFQAVLDAAVIAATVAGNGPWVITFATAPTTVTMDGTALTETTTVAATGVAATAAPTGTYDVTAGSANGGSFTLTVDAVTTGAIAWNALQADFQAALDAAVIAATVTGNGPWVVTFATAPTTVTIDGTGLTQPPASAVVPAFVVVPASLPAGTLTGFRSWNQAAAGSSPTPSAGQTFTAYVLRPTGAPGEYLVVFASAQQTVPALTTAGISEAVTYPVASVPVQAGDILAFYGAGIPVDTDPPGLDLFSLPAPTAPVQGATITVGGAEFPLVGQPRTYSFAASVIDPSILPPPTIAATATAYGSVEKAPFEAQVPGGSGYSVPTIDFDMPDDPNGVQAKAHVASIALGDPVDGLQPDGSISAIILDEPGSGYATAPHVVIRNGTLQDPINGISPATATTTLAITSIIVDGPGDGYVTAPTVTIDDPTGTNAAATATVSAGAIIAINIPVGGGGSGYITPGGIKKFTDPLPGLCDPTVRPLGDPLTPGSCPDWAATPGAKAIPLAVADPQMYAGVLADQYEIGLVQYRTSFSSSLKDAAGNPVGTLVRGYVQLDPGCTTAGGTGSVQGSQCFPLRNELLNGTFVDTGHFGATAPQWLGPVIAATKDQPVRIIFRNLLPTGSDGDLFLPTDSSLMGSGMAGLSMYDPEVGNPPSVLDGARNPDCTQDPKPDVCFKDNRATLHLHGGITPWISDGTPHQWITPANQTTAWPQGVSVSNVPDMAAAGCDGTTDGCMTFYYTNQQSARLMFYHDHAWGITRLNVYAGEAAGYLISDKTEEALMAGPLKNVGLGIPLIIQDRTFVPQDSKIYNVDINGKLNWEPGYDPTQIVSYGQDPTWDASRWGGHGNFWYHHVYMTAQNPGDPGGMSGYGRWMYGPWFWPPAAATKFGPIDNPYYDPACNLDDPATHQYDTDPFCEPQQIPGTPLISTGMEQFNDTPIVNGVAYPTITLEPKAYRFRILSAANDRFFNFQWYVGDPTTASTDLNNLVPRQTIGATEVALNPTQLLAAQTDPVVSPTPVQSLATAGPDWIQIGTEGGFLPAPVVVDGQQQTTWITDPTRFDVGNVDKHSLLLAPAERADVIVDFSKFAGKTLILYNDAPAAFPARVPSYDYYTGAPDLSPVGAPAILPGYGPNTRTIMQVKIAGTPAPAFNVTALRTAFSHKANGTGVFESGQHPIIVGQAAYNSAYGTTFAASSNCNAPGSTLTRCDGLVRVNDTTLFGFNTLKTPNAKMVMPLEPKAIHDEMNATTFDEYGRMQATLGLEAQPPTPGGQNVVLYPYVNPQTEFIDATKLPKNVVMYDAATGLPASDVKITPISDALDGSQIWRITHNGVDTHPIHFHLYDVQVLNRVTWDNIVIPTDLTELGWKDTVRMSPLEDTIVALRPIIPALPWELPNAIRHLSPMMAPDSTQFFNNIDPQGNPTAPIVNQLVNFGWEYVYHCHILSHEEMDMMRPVSVAMPPNVPDGLSFDKPTHTLTWSDNSINETSFVVQRSTDGGTTWTDIGSSPSPLDQPNTHGTRTFTDPAFDPNMDYQYRVVAMNTVGYGLGYPTMTAQSVSAPVSMASPPSAPTNLGAVLAVGPQITLTWQDNANNETGFVIERATGAGPFSQIGTVGANIVTYLDNTALPATTYSYRVKAVNAVGDSLYSNTVQVVVPALPAAPTLLTAVVQTGPQVLLTWRDNATTETGFVIERAMNGGAFAPLATVGPRTGTGNVTYIDATVAGGNSYTYRVAAQNAGGMSAYSNTRSVTLAAPPAAPTNLTAVVQSGPSVLLTWTDNATTETGFVIERAVNGGAFATLTTRGVRAGTGSVTYTNTTVAAGNTYTYRVAARYALGLSAYSNVASVTLAAPAAPSPVTATAVQRTGTAARVTLTWTNVANETGYRIQRATNSTFTAGLVSSNVGVDVTTFTTPDLPRFTNYYFRVRALNLSGVSPWVNASPFPIRTP